MFSIKFEETEPPLGRAAIQIGSFWERFEAVLEYYSVTDYQAQWRAALKSVIEGADRSALITSITDPSTANFIFWWPLYRVGDRVAIQNQALFLADLPVPFCVDRFVEAVPARETVSEEGDPISEWWVDLSDIAVFLASA